MKQFIQYNLHEIQFLVFRDKQTKSVVVDILHNDNDT